MTCLLLTDFIKILKDPESVCACANQCYQSHRDMSRMLPLPLSKTPPGMEGTLSLMVLYTHLGAEVETSLCL